jgi:hypothetical protein
MLAALHAVLAGWFSLCRLIVDKRPAANRSETEVLC